MRTTLITFRNPDRFLHHSGTHFVCPICLQTAPTLSEFRRHFTGPTLAQGCRGGEVRRRAA